LNKVTALLREFGDFVVKHIDHADELGENALYRFAQYGYIEPTTGQMKVDKDGQPLGRDTVLCPDMPARLQKVERALRKLHYLEENSIRLAYCEPLQEDGQPLTVSQMARKLRINKGKFKAELRTGKKHLEKLL